MNPATEQLLNHRIAELGNLPVLPTVLHSLSECLSRSSENVDVERVVDLISCDESLAAQCLRLANSALFHHRSEVRTVRDAVRSMGLARVRDLVYSCSLPTLFANVKQGMAAEIFWRHALGTALISQYLARRLSIKGYEKFYLAGLLHDIGILVNALLFQERFHEVLRVAQTSEVPLVEVERRSLGFSHCDSGRALANLWKLPEDLATTIECHHGPAIGGADPEMTAVVSLADSLCRLRGLGYGYYEAREFDLASEQTWKFLVAKFPAAAQLDVHGFTFELDEQAVQVRALVDAILSGSKSAS
jgi:HD-like signal output (HDOD) protein